MNFTNLNRILRLEIFLHKDGQLQATHIILEYNPSTKCFQNPKNVIRARDPRLALIDVSIPGFLAAGPPPVGTQDVQLPAALATRILYSQKQPLPTDEELKEPTPEPVQEVTDRDFEAFYCKDAPSASQAHTSEGMGFKEKTLDLLALLKAHAEGFSLTVAVVSRPPTPTATHASSVDVVDKKRERGQEIKGFEDAEEREVT